MAQYQSRDVTLEAEQYSGQNLAALEGLASPDRVQVCQDGTVQVRVGNGMWTTVHPGWWVLRWPDQSVSVSTDDFVSRFFSRC